VISPLERLLPTQYGHTKGTNILAASGNRNSDPRNRAVAELRFRGKNTQTAACDLIRGNKSTALFPRIKSQAAGRYAVSVFLPLGCRATEIGFNQLYCINFASQS
jgi:hypothetical protein